MTTYLFSANFNTSVNFHGTIKTSDEGKAIEMCRYEMVKHFTRWGVSSEQITSFEVYYIGERKRNKCVYPCQKVKRN